MCHVWISEKNSDYFAMRPNCLVFISETECVYCAVRTESLNTVRLILIFKQLKCSYKHKGIAITNGSHMQAETEWIQIELVAQA